MCVAFFGWRHNLIIQLRGVVLNWYIRQILHQNKKFNVIQIAYPSIETSLEILWIPNAQSADK